MKKFLIILNGIIPIVLLFTLFVTLVDTVKYDGFMVNHFYVNPVNMFIVAIVFNIVTIFFHSPKSYWWQSKFGRLIRIQSLILAPLTLLLYIWLTLQEGFHYPNYIFSTYHVSLGPLLYFLFLESLILLIPSLRANLNSYIKELLVDQ